EIAFGKELVGRALMRKALLERLEGFQLCRSFIWQPRLDVEELTWCLAVGIGDRGVGSMLWQSWVAHPHRLHEFDLNAQIYQCVLQRPAQIGVCVFLVTARVDDYYALASPSQHLVQSEIVEMAAV